MARSAGRSLNRASPEREEHWSPANSFAIYPSLGDHVVLVMVERTGLGAEFVPSLPLKAPRVAVVDIQDEEGRALAAAVATQGSPRLLFQLPVNRHFSARSCRPMLLGSLCG